MYGAFQALGVSCSLLPAKSAQHGSVRGGGRGGAAEARRRVGGQPEAFGMVAVPLQLRASPPQLSYLRLQKQLCVQVRELGEKEPEAINKGAEHCPKTERENAWWRGSGDGNSPCSSRPRPGAPWPDPQPSPPWLPDAGAQWRLDLLPQLQW